MDIDWTGIFDTVEVKQRLRKQYNTDPKLERDELQPGKFTYLVGKCTIRYASSEADIRDAIKEINGCEFRFDLPQVMSDSPIISVYVDPNEYFEDAYTYYMEVFAISEALVLQPEELGVYSEKFDIPVEIKYLAIGNRQALYRDNEFLTEIEFRIVLPSEIKPSDEKIFCSVYVKPGTNEVYRQSIADRVNQERSAWLKRTLTTIAIIAVALSVILGGCGYSFALRVGSESGLNPITVGIWGVVIAIFVCLVVAVRLFMQGPDYKEKSNR